MREMTAVIRRMWQVGDRLQRLELTVENLFLDPGQSLLAHSGDLMRGYLREQWYPVELEGERLVVERHLDTVYATGHEVSLLAPVGMGYPWHDGMQKNLLLLAYDAYPTPLVMLANKALAQGCSVALVLIGEARHYPLAALPSEVEVLPADDGRRWQHQDDTITWADQIFAVTDDIYWQEALTELHHLLRRIKIEIPVSYAYGVPTMPMPCGAAACMACVVRCKTTNKFACTQGPALDITELLL
jgi:hypothetical protein